MTSALRRAQILAVLVPGLLLAGAWGFQLIGRLFPCEMCHWQRWPHYAALALALLSFAVGGPRTKRTLVAGAAALVVVSGLIGVFHAGVEYHWWQGITACTQTVSTAGMDLQHSLDAIMHAPIVRCDQAQWSLLGLSLAGWNAILSFAGAGLIVWQSRSRA